MLFGEGAPEGWRGTILIPGPGGETRKGSRPCFTKTRKLFSACAAKTCIMPEARSFILPLIALLIAGICMVPAAASEAPFSFTVSPEETTVRAGENVNYTVTVTAENNFDSPIAFSMNFTIGEYSASLPVETCPAPYPRICIYSVRVPTTVPTGILANVVMTGTSGTYSHRVGKLKVTTSGAQGISGVIYNSVQAETRESSSIFQYFANQTYSGS